MLVPSGRHADIVALFEHRTTFGTIKGWRKGRRRAPQWAWDIIAKRMAPHARIAAHAQSAIGAIAGNYANNTAAGRAAQMEKARG